MSGSIAKTKDKLVDVARQLFAKIGVEDTTMNDIAVASQKGRRTLYMYFKSKEEIYRAVVQSELKILNKSLETVVNKNIPADEKLEEFIYIRLESIKDAVLRNGTLRAKFFRDIWRVENVRKNFDLKEIACIRSILNEGIATGLFEIENPESIAVVLHHAFKGLEVPYIRGIMKRFVSNDRQRSNDVVNLLFNGIKKNKNILST
ncbi:MAG: TetR/AcrR family transcriptional regulator [Dysgonamonadaceae bacterium]|jgi:AcrR family transcriptional regulator|nr:TetR/AcrR family transcriptional regulator [Dysgonamonadaceae bacterium]